ncbi:MAG TPA: hypothetical protein VKV20_00080 [Ktedonobacteraceae bacterium]|jgi:hypothetical protein|nr:hypothetical protein [Ktedonobacteraceae bacterium]
MKYIPPPTPGRYEELAKLKWKERERIRDLNLSELDTSASHRLSRRAVVLIRLLVIVLVIVAAVVLYRLVF